MSYYNPHAYSNGYPPQQQSGPHFNGYVDPRQSSQVATNGYSVHSSNAYQTNGNYNPSAPPHHTPNGFQPRQSIPQQYNQSLSQQQQYAAPQYQQSAHVQQQYAQPAPRQQLRPPPSHQQPSQPSQPPQPRGFAVAIPASSPPAPAQLNHGYVHMSEIQEQTIPKPPPLDYQNLLLALADEYLAAAYELGANANTVENDSERREYYRLIATGLGCLEAILKRCKLAPEKEATVQLRYASILYEETENMMEAEEALSKGISVCDRYKYFDIKYNMQHLLARVTFSKNAKAAFKFLEQVIADAKAYQHTAWEYAFRFLKVSLHLNLSSSHDLAAAHTQLRIITNLAPTHGDKAILAMATIMEAMVYLKEPAESAGFEQAQRALASVRSLQLDSAIADIPQLTAFISFVDLSCNLQRYYPDPASASMRNMQGVLSELIEGDIVDADGTLALPLSKVTIPPLNVENGIVRKSPDGSLALMFNWMPPHDIYNVGFLMSGITMAQKITEKKTKDQRSEMMFLQGLKTQQEGQEASDRIAKSIILFVRQKSWRERISYYMRIYYALYLASRTSYVNTREQINEAKQLYGAWPDVPNDLFLMTRYLRGILAQGTGELVNAFSAFESIVDDICPSDKYSSGAQSQSHIRNVTQLERELYILSNMNLLQIIRNPHHPNHAQFDEILARIAPHCTQSSNRGITAAYHIINAAAPASSKILDTKQAVLWGNHHAVAVNNSNLVCISLNVMSWKFHSGILVDQSERNVLSCWSMAKCSADRLWISVSAGIMGDWLEAAGRLDEAAQIRAEGMRYARNLPQKIQGVMTDTLA